MENRTTTQLWKEHAVEITDQDAAETTLANVWLMDLPEPQLGELHGRAERKAKKMFEHLFAGNAVKFEYDGATGRTASVTTTTEITCHDFKEGYSAESFFKMTT